MVLSRADFTWTDAFPAGSPFYVQLRHWRYHRRSPAGEYLPQGSAVKAKTDFLFCTNVDCWPDWHLRQGIQRTEMKNKHPLLIFKENWNNFENDIKPFFLLPMADPPLHTGEKRIQKRMLSPMKEADTVSQIKDTIRKPDQIQAFLKENNFLIQWNCALFFIYFRTKWYLQWQLHFLNLFKTHTYSLLRLFQPKQINTSTVHVKQELAPQLKCQNCSYFILPELYMRFTRGFT